MSAAAGEKKKMTLAIHQNTSNGAGYRKSLEGWARAGIKNVEITNVLLDEFLKTEYLAAARRVITDLGLNLVHAATGVTELWEPNPNRAASLDSLKKRCEMFADMGLHHIYSSTATSKKVTRGGLQGRRGKHARGGRGRQAVQHDAHGSNSCAPRRSSPRCRRSCKMTRAAAHPNIAPMLDCYHFWSGLNKFEDLDMIRARRNRPRAFSGCARHAARDAGSLDSNYSRRRNQPADHEFLASLRKRDMPARSRWNSSCQNSSKAIPTKWRAKSARNPKPSCARPAWCRNQRAD